MNQQFYKNMALWVVLLLMILLLVTVLRQSQTTPAEITYTEFLARVEAGEIEQVTLEEGHVTGRYSSGEEFATYIPPVHETLVPELLAKGIDLEARPKRESSVWQQMLIWWVPFLVIIGLWVFFVRQMQTGGGKAMSFGKSRARLLTENQQRVTFDDVAGVEESKIELEEIIAFLRDPKKFTRLGGRIPKGVLLVGLPGTGKTLLARAVAGEAGVPFFSISGSDFVEMFVGVGASRVRDLFTQGKKNAPCIIFIDEIDAVGRHRGAGLGGGHDEREQTLNQLLVEMDGFESNEGVILIAATNRPDVLDPALLRPGRFDRRVVVPRPDLRGRLAILKVHTRRVPLADDVDLEILARGTPGFVGADLQNLVNEAALLAARREAQRVAMADFEHAKDKVLLGAERRSMIMSDEDKRVTAYHEAGHALVALLTDGSDPVHKVTIIPRGMALGVTQTLPVEDRYNLTRKQMVAMITHAMGGRAAEELVFEHISTGASNDLQQATKMAREMICQYGMSERIGPVSYGDEGHDVFLGRDFATRRDYSEKKQQEIDEEVSSLLHAKYADARSALENNRPVLDRIAAALLERETLETSDLALLLAGQSLPPLPPPIETSPSGSEPRSAAPTPDEFPTGEKLPDPEPIPQLAGPEELPQEKPVSQHATILPRDRVTIVGVLNLTPDSFSDGGRFVSHRGAVDLEAAVAAAEKLVAEGADWIDVGGESTRPGATPVAADAEIARTRPVVEALAKHLSVPVSIDTRKAAVAEAALEAGAQVVNDVSGGAHDPGLLEAVARAGAGLVLGHLRGEPVDMQHAIAFNDVVGEVAAELATAAHRAVQAGVARERLLADPGIGFGKSFDHNLELLANLGALRRVLDLPLLVGPSRKAFLGAIVGEEDPRRRDLASHAACAVAIFAGADAIRVHDVAGARQAAAVARALRDARGSAA